MITGHHKLFGAAITGRPSRMPLLFIRANHGLKVLNAAVGCMLVFRDGQVSCVKPARQQGDDSAVCVPSASMDVGPEWLKASGNSFTPQHARQVTSSSPNRSLPSQARHHDQEAT
eukprot:356093-Chlamydomonas_euryale.AAC.9